MVRKVLVGFLLFILFSFFITSCHSFNTEIYDKNIFYVGGNGEGNFSNIQDAINVSLNGDIVYVYSNTYYENIVINKSISLVGEEKNSTIVTGLNNFYFVDILSDNVTIRNLRIEDFSLGIRILNSKNISINNNIFYNNSNGILIDEGCNNISIFSNYFKNNTEGIRVYNSSENMFFDNVFCATENFNILFFGNSENNTINKNIFRKTDTYSIQIKSNSNNNAICENNISDCRDGISVFLSSNILIKDNEIYNITKVGIYLKDCNNIDIHNNSISKTGSNAIYIDNVEEYNITDDNIFSENNLDIKIISPPPKIRIPGVEMTFFVVIVIVSLIIFFIKVRKDRK